MKTACICLALGLVVMMALSSEALIYGVEAAPKDCCFNFVSNRMNMKSKAIVTARRTDAKCPKAAIIVTTAMGRDLCVNPSSKFGKRLAKTIKA
ncbi:monocyte chemotactic protein 1B-like [Engraulis encrasicolus]|uniref:monocyte chemotactic protein 1B-like n=1 Tax=Engraulis encrasicolus TaxID=184585 RepID=UPI002FD3C598